MRWVAGGRGRIRTSVARKERQIYSLLVLATHPPVPTGSRHRDRTYRLHTAERHPLAGVIHAGNSLSFFEPQKMPEAPLRLIIGDPSQHRYDSESAGGGI